MSNESKYMLIYNYLLKNINNSVYGNGKIESENTLCEMFGVSRPTVRQAIMMLENENLVKRVHGSGVYTNYSGYVNRRHRRREKQLKNVAVLFPSLNSPIISAIFSEVEHLLFKNSCELTVRSTNFSANHERRTLEELSDQDVDAIIAVAYQSVLPSVNSELYEDFISRDIPCIFFGEAYNKFSFIGADDYSAAYSMTKRIAGLSHRNIICLLEDKSSSAYEFYRGITRCAADHNMNLDNIKFFWYTPDSIPNTVNSLDFNDCTICICQDEQTANPIMERVQSLGIKVPETLSVVCLSAAFAGEITSNVYPVSKVSDALFSAVIMAAENGITTGTKTFPYSHNSGKTLGFAKKHNPFITGDWADPFILEDGENFYLYPTAYWETPVVYGFSSKNLFHWSNPRSVFNAKESNLQNCSAAWAPSVVKHNGIYYLVFCDKENLVFCKSDSPLGNFELIKDCDFKPIYSPLDPNFIVENGRIFLTCGLTKCMMYELELTENSVRMIGTEKHITKHILSGLNEYEHDQIRYNGGARINKIGGRYVLTWNCYQSSDPRSHIRYAWSDHIDGPYLPHKDNILLSSENNFQGVSHGQILRHNGEYYVFYNRNYLPSLKKERILCFEKLHFTDKEHLYATPTE